MTWSSVDKHGVRESPTRGNTQEITATSREAPAENRVGERNSAHSNPLVIRERAPLRKKIQKQIDPTNSSGAGEKKERGPAAPGAIKLLSGGGSI